jgi:hypothetical protein
VTDDDRGSPWWNLAALILVARGRVRRTNGRYLCIQFRGPVMHLSPAAPRLSSALYRADESRWTCQPRPQGRTRLTEDGARLMRDALIEDGRLAELRLIVAQALLVDA